MSKKYPRYVRVLKGGLYYQRDYPVSLRVFGKKTFTAPLNLKVNNYTDAALQRAITGATESYELKLKMMQNSNLSDYNESEVDKAAADLLRRQGLKEGQFVGDEDFYHYAHLAVPGLEEALDNQGELTVDEAVAVRAYHALQEAASRKPKMLSEVWTEYLDWKKIDISTRDGKRTQRYWERIFAFIGDQRLDNPQTLDAIHSGLDQYCEERRNQGIKVQSIRREYAEVLSALRRASKKYRLGWLIEPNDTNLKSDPVKQRIVLDTNEQIALLRSCLADTKTPEVSAAIIFMMQSGAMCSEIRRLDVDALQEDLNADIPQISIGKYNTTKVKADERRRVVPIVIGRNYIRSHLPESIAWCNRVTESNVSHRIATKMQKATGNSKVTAHCLRHTLKANSDLVDANQSHVACIGGWSGANKVISAHMQQYGAEGLCRSEGFKEVTKTSKKILGHLIEAIKETNHNVVSFETAG